MKKFGLILALSSFAALGLMGCNGAPAKPTGAGTGTANSANGVPVDTDGDGVPDAVVADDIPMDVSLASFQANLYEPLLKPFCASCHATTFVQADAAKAHSEFLNRAGFNKYAGIDQTLPVLKMKQAHNCWDASTKTCVTMMTDKMNLWLTDLEAAGYKPKPVVHPNTTSEIDMKNPKPITLTIPPEYANGGFTAATAAPFVVMNDDKDGAVGTYLTTAAGTAAVAAAPAATAVNQLVNLDAKAAGTYFVWARVKTADAASSKFFIRINNGNVLSYLPGVTGKDVWKWVQVFTVANNAATTTPLTVNVAAAGTVPVNIYVRDPAAKINQIAITTRPDFNGDQFTNSYMELEVPLKVAGADGAKIVATVWKNTVAEGKKSLGVKDLKIVSPVPLHVKNIYPLFNGIFSSNNGAYTQVDDVAGSPTGEVIQTGGSTATTWLTDFDLDKLSFAFDVIEVAK